MSATLATSTDPAQLVPGSLEALGRDADALVAQADALDDAGAQVRRREVPGWLGDASAGWGQRRPQIADSLTVPGQVYRAAADVLRAHAGALVWARAQVEVAIDLWAKGLALSARTADQCLRPGSVLLADRPWTSPLAQSLRAQARGPFQAGVQGSPFARLDPGAPARAMAEQLLAAIRQEVALSARAVAGFLDRCCEGMPDGRWHWDQYYAGLWEWVTGIGALIGAFNVIRFATDTGGYFRDLYAMGAGPVELAQYLAANPHDFNRLVLDSETFRDNPARWWGHLAPDVALTVAGGAGITSKLLSRAGASTRLVDDLAGAAADEAHLGRLSIEGSRFSASELGAAELLAERGYDVVLREATGPDRMSDLLLDGVQYDVYTPETGNISRLVGAIADKGSQVRGGGVVLDLSSSPLTSADVGNLLARVRGVTEKVTDIIVIEG